MDRQTFDRIKSVKAENGAVIIETYPSPNSKIPEKISLPYKEAAKRALALNQMLNKMPRKDAMIGFDIIENIIAACKEAKKQAEGIGGSLGKVLLDGDVKGAELDAIDISLTKSPLELGPE